MIIIPPSSSQRRKPDRQQVQEAAANAGLILPDVAVLALQQGRVIEAVKLIRGANPGLDLARAKGMLERMQAQAHTHTAVGDAGIAACKPSLPLQSRRPPTVAMGDPPGQLRWLLIVVALVAAAAWIGFGGTL